MARLFPGGLIVGRFAVEDAELAEEDALPQLDAPEDEGAELSAVAKG